MSLCDQIATGALTCCDPQPAPPAPAIDNRPNLPTIAYRIGTYATFRQALLAAIPAHLPGWTDRSADDYGIALLEMWAYLGDILTFYQERIANEAYLRTALLRESVVYIVELIDYQLAPGAAAAAYLAFTIEPGNQVALPASFKTQTRPVGGKPPVVFETDAALVASAALNQLRVQTRRPLTQLELGARQVVLKGARADIKAGDRILIVDDVKPNDPTGERWEVRQLQSVEINKIAGITTLRWGEGIWQAYKTPPQRPAVYIFRQQLWPFGYNAPDWNALPDNLRGTITLSSAVRATRPDGTTCDLPAGSRIATTGFYPDWSNKRLPEKEPNKIYLDAVYDNLVADSKTTPSWIALVISTYVELYRIRKVNETAYTNYTLSGKISVLTVDASENIDKFPVRGTLLLGVTEPLELQPDEVILAPLTGQQITLDKLYVNLAPGAVLVLSGALASSVTSRLDLARAAGVAVDDAVSLATIKQLLLNPQLLQDRRTPLAKRLPALEPDVLALVAAILQQGVTWNTEVVVVKSLDQTAPATVVTLVGQLTKIYDIESVTLMGNVVQGSHGETIKDEILGSGDASQPNQRFTLKKSPVTFVRAPAAPRGVQNTLQIVGNGVRWQEQASLLQSGPADRAYVTEIDPDDRMTAIFGDGRNGARVPSGKDNVHARYRKGLGTVGNVPPGAIVNLVDSLPGLKAVINPLNGTGGADRERAQDARVNAPASVRAFDRAVSLADYAALARTISGVAKAAAFWRHVDPTNPGRRLEQPWVQLTIASTDRLPLQPAFKKALRQTLDSRRDPNQPMDIADYEPVPIDLDVTIQVADDYVQSDVRAAVEAALSAPQNPDGTYGLFAFERLDFGQSIHLSDIYAVVQAVPGVRSAIVKRLAHAPAALGDVQEHIFIKNTQLIQCENDPADTADTKGKLAVTIGGGGVKG